MRLDNGDTLVGWAPMVLALAISWTAAIAIGFLVVQATRRLDRGSGWCWGLSSPFDAPT